jgi:hypothetical protein
VLGALIAELILQRRNAPAQFVYDIIEMTDCILEAINSATQAYISALTGRLCSSISLTGYRLQDRGHLLSK